MDVEGVVEPECGLDNHPVGDPAVSRHGVKVEVSVQVVLGPFDLPNYVLVLAILGGGYVRRFAIVLLQVEHSNVAISHANGQHVRMNRVNVDSCHSRPCVAKVLRVRRILQGEDADNAIDMGRILLVEVVGAKSGSKQVLVCSIPAQTSYFQLLGPIERKIPEWEESTLRFPEFV